MQPPPSQNPNSQSGQGWPQQPNPQSGQLPQSQPLQPAPNYDPTPGNPWPPQPQGYQQGYQQQPMQPQPAPGPGWPQQQGYAPQQQMYQQPVLAPAQMTSVNVNVNAQQKNNGCVRAIYFVFIGWWLGFWALQLGFALCLFIFTLPLGLIILNRLPQIMTLKTPTQTTQTSVNVTSVASGGNMVNTVNVNVNVSGIKQRPFLLRAVYYIFIGSWVGYIWASLGYFFCLSILGLPLGIIMLNQIPVVLTLRRT